MPTAPDFSAPTLQVLFRPKSCFGTFAPPMALAEVNDGDGLVANCLKSTDSLAAALLR